MELELSILSKDLDYFETELLFNKRILRSIKENISFLKNESMIVSFSEYKKIKQQKKLIEARIDYYTSKIGPLKHIVNMKEINHKEEMKKFEYAYRMQFKNNILEFPGDRRKKA